MPQNFTVNYNINVVGVEKAAKALNQFASTTAKLQKASADLKQFQSSLNSLVKSFDTISKKPLTLRVNTTTAARRLDSIITKLQIIKKETTSAHVLALSTKGSQSLSASRTGTGGTSTAPASSGTGGGTSNQRSRASRAAGPRYAPVGRARGQNWSYRALGPSMIDSGGIGAIDMLKGMGIMYGITGLGSLMGKIMRDATDYDNLMTTTRGMLSVHDNGRDFSGRFSQMEKIVRNVGVETKFTAPEVASAAKFLAMAGLQVSDINAAIRPVADVALIGDSELGQTADLMTNIMTGFELPSSQMRNAADVMVSTFTSSNTTLEQLAESYKYIGALASNNGISFEEASAALGVLGNAGRQGTMAGTDLRMIMQNMLKPTKAQAAQWQALGITPTTEDGKLRPLNQIFHDLAAKDVTPQQIANLFRTTASTGSMILARHVGDWDEIMRRNYASQGLSAQLSDEKKNTIQGLWAQITSQFTENGMQEFENYSGEIRRFLNEILSWLKTGEAKKYMHDLFDMFTDLMKMFKDFTKTLLDVYDKAGPFIKGWLEWQVKLSAILIPLRIFRGLIGFGGLLIKNAIAMGRFTTAMGAFIIKGQALKNMGLRGAFTAICTSLANTFGGASGTMGAGMAGGRMAAGARVAGGGAANSIPVRDVIARYNRIHHYNWLRSGAMHAAYNPMASAGANVGGMVGGVLGGLAGMQVGEPGSAGNAIATIGGSMFGSVGMGLGTAMIMGGNPYGWAVLAGVGGILLLKAIASMKAKADEATESFKKMSDAIKVENGISIGEGATTLDKHLDLIYNKNLSATEVVQRRVDLLKEEMGLGDGTGKDDGANTNMDIIKSIAESAEKQDSWFGGDLIGAMAYRANRLNSNTVTGLHYDNNDFVKFIGLDGRGFSFVSGDKSAAALSLYEQGYKGTDTSATRAELQNRLRAILMTGGSLADVKEVLMPWNNRYGNISGNLAGALESFGYSYSDVQGWSPQRVYNSLLFKYGMRDALYGTYGFGAQGGVWDVAQRYYGALDNGKMTEDLAIEYISKMNAQIGDTINRYSNATARQWAWELGFRNGEWVGVNGLSAQENATKMRDAISQILEVLGLLPPGVQGVTGDLRTKLQTMLNVANFQIAYGENGKGADGLLQNVKIGQTQTLDGKTYRWDGLYWRDTSNLANSIAFPISMGAMRKGVATESKRKNNASTANNNDNTPTTTAATPTASSGGNGRKGGGSKGGVNASDYKNHYQSQNAAPKQVIVNISNLMNVSKIDLSKKDNSEVINNLKQQLSQTLIDVVHDFDESWNG